MFDDPISALKYAIARRGAETMLAWLIPDLIFVNVTEESMIIIAWSGQDVSIEDAIMKLELIRTSVRAELCYVSEEMSLPSTESEFHKYRDGPTFWRFGES